VVAAARLAREDVHEQRRARAQRLLVVSAVVGDAGVAALRDDALAVLGEAVGDELGLEQPAQVAERDRPRAVGAEAVARAAQRLEVEA